MKQTNLSTSLKCRKRPSNGMNDFDSLPPIARQWLAQAVLPWSAASVKRVWHKAMVKNNGSADAALSQLCTLEQQRLARDVPMVWGSAYPTK